VESDAVCVAPNRPNQDDVTCESASLIRLGRDIHGGHFPPVDRQPPQYANASCRIPGRAVHDLGEVANRSRGSDDGEVLIRRFARTDYPASPRPRTAPDPTRADDVELTASAAMRWRQARREAGWTRNGVADRAGRSAAFREELPRCSNKLRQR